MDQQPERVSGVPTIGHPGKGLGRLAQLLGHLKPRGGSRRPARRSASSRRRPSLCHYPTPTIAISVDGMRSAIVVLGVIVALAGLLFAMQGFGEVSGSPITNTTTWSILGPITSR